MGRSRVVVVSALQTHAMPTEFGARGPSWILAAEIADHASRKTPGKQFPPIEIRVRSLSGWSSLSQIGFEMIAPTP